MTTVCIFHRCSFPKSKNSNFKKKMRFTTNQPKKKVSLHPRSPCSSPKATIFTNVLYDPSEMVFVETRQYIVHVFSRGIPSLRNTSRTLHASLHLAFSSQVTIFSVSKNCALSLHRQLPLQDCRLSLYGLYYSHTISLAS